MTAVNPIADQYLPIQGAKATNPVFNRDSLSLGNVAPQYQNYAAPITQNAQKGWEVRPFGSVARISMSQLLSVILGDCTYLPECCDPPADNLSEEKREFLQSFHARILAVTDFGKSLQDTIDLGERGEELSDDEKINTIIAKYANEPIGHALFDSMMQELLDSRLFNFEDLRILHIAGRMGLITEEYRLHHEFEGFVKKNEGKNISIPDLYDLFMEELEKRDEQLSNMQKFAVEKDKDKRSDLFHEINEPISKASH
jgi:hypothetical protein